VPQLSPAVARRRDLSALERQGAAIESLKRSHEDLAQKVDALQEQADRALPRLLDGLTAFEQRLQALKSQGRALLTHGRAATTLSARQDRKVRALAQAARLQQVTAVVSATQAAAYGEKGRLLSTNNLLLAGNQLLWIFIDPLLRTLGIPSGPSPSLATWLAPVGVLVTGHLALGNRQHVRFLSGVATFDGSSPVFLEPLRSRIADSLWPEFQRRTDVPVTTTPLHPAPAVRFAAAVRQGVLMIVMVPIDEIPIPTGRVAWMVDTGVDVG
jgi:hypothetical protein